MAHIRIAVAQICARSSTLLLSSLYWNQRTKRKEKRRAEKIGRNGIRSRPAKYSGYAQTTIDALAIEAWSTLALQETGGGRGTIGWIGELFF
jgi:hypothetical protein